MSVAPLAWTLVGAGTVELFRHLRAHARAKANQRATFERDMAALKRAAEHRSTVEREIDLEVDAWIHAFTDGRCGRARPVDEFVIDLTEQGTP